MSLAWGVKRRIFLEGRGEKGREENVDRSEGRTIISGRNQKSFISSTLISTKVIPLARLRKFSTLILDYVAASKGPFFDLSPLFCFQTRRVFEGETFHSRSKFSSFFPSSIDGEKKFERGGVNFFHSKIEKKRNPKSNEANVRVLFLSLHSPRPRCYANTSNPRINTSKCKTNTANHSVLTPQDLNYYHLSSFPSAWFYIFFLFPLPFRNKNREPPKPCFTSSNERIIRLSLWSKRRIN